jgi:hypothetical protein
MNRFCVDLTDKELEDLKVIIDLVYSDFDFHGDLIDMRKPLDKLAKELGMKLEEENE